MLRVNDDALTEFGPEYWADSLCQYFEQWWIESLLQVAWDESVNR